MDSFEKKTAFVTGAASGIGLALSRALVEQGANVMMADIDKQRLGEAAAGLAAPDNRVATVQCDVANPQQLEAAAAATIEAFGKVHLTINNAGVGLGGRVGATPLKDWQWIVDINLLGVVYGVETFLPLIRSHGEGGHIVNTASMAGHITTPGMAPYHATKYAVVGYSESIAEELKNEGIGVSVLCPTWVQSNIYNTANLRPSASAGATPAMSDLQQALKQQVETGMPADRLANLVLKSVREQRLYIFNDDKARAAIDHRRNAILKDYDACLADLNSTA